MVHIGEPKLCQVLSSLKCFVLYTYEDSLDIIAHSFMYINITIHNQSDIDYGLIKFQRKTPNFFEVNYGFLKDYSDVKEKINLNLTMIQQIMKHN